MTLFVAIQSTWYTPPIHCHAVCRDTKPTDTQYLHCHDLIIAQEAIIKSCLLSNDLQLFLLCTNLYAEKYLKKQIVKQVAVNAVMQ